MSMNRSVFNIIIDLIAALQLVGMLATGYLLRFPLPPGTNKAFSLWGLTRHQWGDIHFWISLGLILTMIVHLTLHWNWIVTVIGKRCGLVKDNKPSMIRSAVWTIVVFAGLCLGFAWVVEMNIKEIPRPGRGHWSGSNRNNAVQTATLPTPASESETSHLVWSDVYPIFEKNCLSCHGPHKQWASFRVDQRQEFFKPDAPLVVSGNSGQSPLIAIISGERANMAMAESHKLSAADVSRIKLWIDQGAE